MIRPRFTDKERSLLIHALRCYATHLQILGAEQTKDILHGNLLLREYQATQDLNVLRELKQITAKLLPQKDCEYGAKASAALLLIKRLQPEGKHGYVASEVRFILRNVPLEAVAKQF